MKARKAKHVTINHSKLTNLGKDSVEIFYSDKAMLLFTTFQGRPKRAYYYNDYFSIVTCQTLYPRFPDSDNTQTLSLSADVISWYKGVLNCKLLVVLNPCPIRAFSPGSYNSGFF